MRRGKGEEMKMTERECTGKTPSLLLCVLFMTMTYSTHTDIKIVTKFWHDVHMTVYWSFSGRVSL